MLYSWSMGECLAALQAKCLAVGVTTKNKGEPCDIYSYCFVGREHIYRLRPQGSGLYLTGLMAVTLHGQKHEQSCSCL